jgi:MFS family permease
VTVESRPLASRILAPGRVHYGWAMAGVTLLVLVMSAGFRSTAGVLIVPLEHEFGWSAATVSSAVSINLIMFGLGAPFAAALHERFGVRRVTVTALLVVAAASAATTLISAPWELRLLWGLVIGTATGAVSIPLAAIVGNRWFIRRRGLVTGIMTSANATGQLIFLPILATIVTTAGWRWASATVAVVALLVVVPLAALIMRDHPADLGLAPYGGEEIEAPRAPTAGPVRTALGGLREGARSGTFWLLTGSFFVCGASTNGLVGTHLIPAAHDHGISEVTAASYLAAIGVFDIIGTTFSGWLTDRYDPRLLLFWYYGLRGLSLLALHSVLG